MTEKVKAPQKRIALVGEVHVFKCLNLYREDKRYKRPDFAIKAGGKLYLPSAKRPLEDFHEGMPVAFEAAVRKRTIIFRAYNVRPAHK